MSYIPMMNVMIALHLQHDTRRRTGPEQDLYLVVTPLPCSACFAHSNGWWCLEVSCITFYVRLFEIWAFLS